MAFPSSHTEKDGSESGTNWPAGSASHQRWRHLPMSADCSPSTSATITTTSSSSSSSRHLVNKGQAIRHLDGQLICHPLDKRVSIRSCPRGLILQQAVKVKRFKESSPPPNSLPHATRDLPPQASPDPGAHLYLNQRQATEQKIPFWIRRCRPNARLYVFGRAIYVSRSRSSKNSSSFSSSS